MTASSLISNHWVGSFFQDTWRVSENVTLNVGLRYEYETGLTEKNDQMLTGFDPNADVAIAQLAEAAYARNPIPQLAPSAFDVHGGTVYAGDAGQTGLELGRTIDVDAARIWFLVDERADRVQGRLRHVLRRAECHQLHAQPARIQRDDGQRSERGFWADVAPRRSEERHLADVGSVSGAEHWIAVRLSRSATRSARTRRSAPVSRPRILPASIRACSDGASSVQREISRNMAVEIAYNGSRGDRLDRNDPSGLLAGRVVERQQRPRSHAAEPAERQRHEPVLHQQLRAAEDVGSGAVQPDGGKFVLHEPDHSAASAAAPVPPHVERGWSRVFRHFRWERTERTRSRSASIAGSPMVSPRTSSIPRRNSRRTGRSRNTIASRRSGRQLRKHGRTASQPTSSPSSRSAARSPFSTTAACLPRSSATGRSAATYEWQPGALLEWPASQNIFFYGDLDDIELDNPTIDRWFNTDAGFEKDPAKVPAAFQKRAFPFRIDGVRAPSLKHLNMNIGTDCAVAWQQDAAIPRRRAQRFQQRDVRHTRT